MGDLIPLTFKVSEDFSAWLACECGRHDVSRSDFVRNCIRIAAPLLLQQPELLSADDKRIADLMGKVGKILVILDKD